MEQETGYVAAGKEWPAAVIHRSKIRVGEQFVAPRSYQPPAVRREFDGSLTVVPATPSGFTTIETGTTIKTDGIGNTSVDQTNLEGFVNYGTPVRSIVPLRNQQGAILGNRMIELSPNPIWLPVTTTIAR